MLPYTTEVVGISSEWAACLPVFHLVRLNYFSANEQYFSLTTGQRKHQRSISKQYLSLTACQRKHQRSIGEQGVRWSRWDQDLLAPSHIVVFYTCSTTTPTLQQMGCFALFVGVQRQATASIDCNLSSLFENGRNLLNFAWASFRC
jgi:hypothetical protein